MEAPAIIIGYLLGSIPFAYIAGRLTKGIDIRQAGGGNVGAVNTLREVDTAAGIVVLVADIAKGTAAVLIAQWLGLSLIFVYIVGFAAVVEHNWPVFLKFRRGHRGSYHHWGAVCPDAHCVCYQFRYRGNQQRLVGF